MVFIAPGHKIKFIPKQRRHAQKKKKKIMQFKLKRLCGYIYVLEVTTISISV